ncbi:MAG: signal peptidase I [Candidatus Yonathbacteria bacterium RIFCSPLOWO2_01_FULL_43_27]|uniref:Signal peptidase I n=1 Tax=Candidatus Yonathbacteria bacterium RIFCSPLOWO2_01_FULL_43_27 TaxID=1802726 RepID=A0A1G2SD84_9BACT|nr:MAG: signal peptidase I [Candidatus Yonathbacteria bacterium RIFCSPHIGHO2_01_FULL_44_19]OHA82662.1 MAG: signal peptidase I [Candidatus Yonathbacteria bacterium RIFCSPLOWO2_01_FULL_43_27]
MIKILTYIFGAMVIVIALLLVVSFFPIMGNYKIMIVQSGSMEPTIKTGSIVIVKPAPSYDVGDVITFGPTPRGKISTTHRIVAENIKNGLETYTTKGDSNDSVDLKGVLQKDVLGKVYLSVPFVGYALTAVKEPIGFLILIIVPALLILFDEGKKIFLELKKMKRGAEENTQS